MRTDIWDVGRGYWNNSSFIAYHKWFLTCSHVPRLFDWLCFHFGVLAYFSTTLVPFYLTLLWLLGERRLPLGHKASTLLSHLSPARRRFVERRGLTPAFSLPWRNIGGTSRSSPNGRWLYGEILIYPNYNISALRDSSHEWGGCP